MLYDKNANGIQLWGVHTGITASDLKRSVQMKIVLIAIIAAILSMGQSVSPPPQTIPDQGWYEAVPHPGTNPDMPQFPLPTQQIVYGYVPYQPEIVQTQPICDWGCLGGR